MAAFFGCPAPDPMAPRTIKPQKGCDFAVVAGEIVFGKQVNNQTCAGNITKTLLLRGPLLALEWTGEVLAEAPRDVLVREPFLCLT